MKGAERGIKEVITAYFVECSNLGFKFILEQL